jgi:hypothetical protein
VGAIGSSRKREQVLLWKERRDEGSLASSSSRVRNGLIRGIAEGKLLLKQLLLSPRLASESRQQLQGRMIKQRR